MLTDKQFGRYKVRQKLGSGGMGEVYQAHDSQLDRSVALKILSSDFTLDAERQNRFKQEARAASALNHPNIITIYEIGESENGYYLATELIDGETLRDILKRSPISVPRAIKYAEQIANALTAAHEARIVHRDIKPENIMIRRDGWVKVLDFGLAKPTSIRNDSGSEDVTQEIVKTTPGLVMGSIRYMSPEQARGLTVDERTDIWSLGVVLYEMLTGHTPFEGATTSDTLVAVIHQEPQPLARFTPNAPAELQRIIRKALKKDREERYQNVKDFALDLKNLLYELEHEISLENKTQPLPAYSANLTGSAGIHQTSGTNQTTHTTYAPGSSAEFIVNQVKTHKWQTVFASLGVLALLVAVTFGFSRWFGTKPSEASAVFEKTQVSRLTTDGRVRLPAISPDGKYVAYVSGEYGNRGLVVRQVATDSIVMVVPPSSLDFRSVNFSPDGNYLYYTQLSRDFTLGTLYQIPTLGGTPKKIIEDVDSEISFSPDGKRLAFMRNSTKESSNFIFVANADGSNPQQLTGSKSNGFNSFTAPAWSPDGLKILVGAGKSNSNNNGALGEAIIAEISVADGSFKPLNSQKWVAIDSLNWFKKGSALLLTAKETEEASMQVWRIDYPTGEAQAVTNDFNNYFGLGISDDGTTLITSRGDSVSTLWSFAPATKELTQILPESRNYEGRSGISQSPDGRLVYSRYDGKESHIWTMDADGRNPRQLTTELRHSSGPVLGADGRFIVFVSKEPNNSARIWRMEADGKNPVRLTNNNGGGNEYNPQITPDGKTVVFQSYNTEAGVDELLKVSIEGGTAMPLFPPGQISRFMPRLSPDGKHLAFISFDNATIQKKLQVAEFNGDAVGRIENTFDYNFINYYTWSPDSKSLTYVGSDGVPNVWKLPLDGSKPQAVTDFKTGNIFNFGWSRDGKRLFLVRGIFNNDLILIRDLIKNS